MILLCKTELPTLEWTLNYIPLKAFALKSFGMHRIFLYGIRLPPKVAPTEAQVRYVKLVDKKSFSDGRVELYVKFLPDSVAEHTGTLIFNYDERQFFLQP